MTLKTIKKQKNWPKWAKYYAKDMHGRAAIFSHEPQYETCSVGDYWACHGTWRDFKIKPVSAKVSKNSLRKIV